MHTRTPYVFIATATTVAAFSIGAHFVQSANPDEETVFVPITPCRLVDTRAGDLNVGPRDGKLGADETADFIAWGTGDAGSPCDIPATATAIATNTVAVAPTARSFMTLFPGGVANPGTANLNYVAGQAPTPNAAIAPLAADGSFNVFNAFGEVHVVIDVNGYYQPSSNVGSPGPAGDQGPSGTDGENGAPNRISDADIAIGAWHNDPGAAATIDNGENPAGIATDGELVYVTNGIDGTVSVIDPAANVVLEKIAVGNTPIGIAFDGTHLYVTNSADDTVSVIDPSTRTVIGSPIAVGSGPLGIGYGSGAMYVADRNGNSVTVIDTTSKAVIATVALSEMPFDIAYDGTHVFVTTGDSSVGFVVAIDPMTNTVVGSPIPTGRQSQGLVFTGTHLYVANANQSTISVIDTTSLTNIDTITLPFQPTDVEYDGRYVYVVFNAEDGYIAIDPFSGNPASLLLPSGDTPNRIVFDGVNLFITNFLDQSISKVLPV